MNKFKKGQMVRIIFQGKASVAEMEEDIGQIREIAGVPWNGRSYKVYNKDKTDSWYWDEKELEATDDISNRPVVWFIESHRKQWNFISAHPTMSKEDYNDTLPENERVENLSYCFLCKAFKLFDKCPLQKVCVGYSRYNCLGGLYMKYKNACEDENWPLVSRIAKEIAELPAVDNTQPVGKINHDWSGLAIEHPEGRGYYLVDKKSNKTLLIFHPDGDVVRIGFAAGNAGHYDPRGKLVIT